MIWIVKVASGWMIVFGEQSLSGPQNTNNNDYDDDDDDDKVMYKWNREKCVCVYEEAHVKLYMYESKWMPLVQPWAMSYSVFFRITKFETSVCTRCSEGIFFWYYALDITIRFLCIDNSIKSDEKLWQPNNKKIAQN